MTGYNFMRLSDSITSESNKNNFTSICNLNSFHSNLEFKFFSTSLQCTVKMYQSGCHMKIKWKF